jgi:hypothetical protein
VYPRVVTCHVVLNFTSIEVSFGTSTYTAVLDLARLRCCYVARGLRSCLDAVTCFSVLDLVFLLRWTLVLLYGLSSCLFVEFKL